MPSTTPSLRGYRRLSLGIAAALGLGSGPLLAQSTSGSIYGNADADAEVTVTNKGNGSTRSLTVGPGGSYQFNALLPGDYEVKLVDHGQARTERVTVVAGQGANVNLAATSSAKNLDTITVSATSLPNIDVSSVQTSTVITAEQMKSLPIARNVTAVALLTPGAVQGDAAFGNLASFGGASVAENSYYVNGFNVTNQFDSLSFSQVPFEAIEQESVQDGGYGAEYGNSTGGVVSVTTKRGTNEWKGGVDVTWNPHALMARSPNVHLNNGAMAYNSGRNRNSRAGSDGLGSAIDFDTRWNAWVGGPLIKDHLFAFGLISQTKTQIDSYGAIQSAGGGGFISRQRKEPYWLLKLDWNINDSNILEYTGFNDTRHYQSDYYYSGFAADKSPYHYGYQGTSFTKLGGQTNIVKYTSYITDDFTLSTQYGQSRNNRYNQAIAANGTVESYPGVITEQASGCPRISDQRDPVLAGTLAPYPRCSFVGSLVAPQSYDSRKSFRVDLEYNLGDHDIKGGWSRDRTVSFYGTGYEGGSLWYYYGAPEDNLAQQIIFNSGAKVGMTQRAAYLQDNWHITDNFLLRYGVRNDQFNNQNDRAQTYVSQAHNLQPRLGFAWDVHGDSSLKIYGSAGDYSLPIDAGVAVRGAAASIYSYQYFTYDGVDPVTGAPLNPIATGPLKYSNGSSGVSPNPQSYATQNLKPFKQREFVLGAQQQVGDWTFGAKATLRRVLNGIDDLCDFRPIARYANEHYGMDLDPNSLNPPADNLNLRGCYIANPGNAVDLNLPLDPNHPDKLYPVHMSGKDTGQPRYKRGYYALALTAERAFTERFYANVSYTFARSYGNSEGLVNSNNGQADTGTSTLFDYPELMYGANGPQTNDHTHTVKAYGAFKLTPEWTLGANLLAQTGRPKNCYGDAPIDYTIGGYGSSGGSSPYLWCVVDGEGNWSSRGSAGRTPTLWQLDLNAAYAPNWLKGLTFRATVYNVFNRHTTLAVNENQNVNYTPGNPPSWSTFDRTRYLNPTSFQTPRYVQLNVEYDF